MPIVQVEMIKGRTREQKKRMIEGVTAVMVETLHCPREAVKIVIRDMDPDDYAVGGVLYSEQKK
jgi:4-oxalocrotonate tautomerase